MNQRLTDEHRTAKAGRRPKRVPLYEPLDWMLVRAPLLPIENYLATSRPAAHVESATMPGADAETMVPRDPRVGTALAVGSADLLEALTRTSPGAANAPDLWGKLLRYLIRMSTRPTPFGLFAGVALGAWADTTDLALATRPPRTRTRPDMGWLLAFCLALEAKPQVRRHLNLFANPAAHVRAGRVFLAERPMSASPRTSPAPVSIRATGVVLQALALTRTPVPHGRLVAELAARSGAAEERVEGLIDQLWEQGILLTDLRPPLTTGNPARHVAHRLATVPAAAEALARLQAVLESIDAWDARPWELGSDGFVKLASLAKADSDGKASKTPLQVDMALELDGTHVAKAVGEDVARAGELLVTLTPWTHGSMHLDGYRQAFEERYGTDREVPLLELLDPNFGLGPVSGHGHGSHGGMDPVKSLMRQQTLLDLATNALRSGGGVVDLDDATIERLRTWVPSPAALGPSLDLAVFVLASSPEAIDRGDYQIVIGPNLGAMAAGRNLGRFADLLAPHGEAALRRAAAAEARHEPSRLVAEIVYLPRNPRSANVVLRPAVREYEIPFESVPGVPAGRVIRLDELTVGVSGGRFYVRWPSRDVEIVAVAGHMLNNMQAPEVCRFLEEATRDGLVHVNSWDWGPAADFPFLPRVQSGRLVLHPAQWRLSGHSAIALLPDRPGRFSDALGPWRQRWQVPQYVYLTVGDNRLLLDLDDPSQADQMRSELRRLEQGGRVLLQEALPGPDHVWTAGPEGHYVVELVVPLVLRNPPTQDDAETRGQDIRVAVLAEERLRPPGSEWLFAKIYCPRAFEEDVIAQPMRSLCEFATTSGLADEWFFIRYADPDPHLRLRFRGDGSRLLGELLPQVSSWARDLMRDGLCTRFAIDTYDREIERYGGVDGTRAAEQVFAADSRAVAELLSLTQGPTLELDRITVAVLSIDDLLAGLGLSESQRLAWYRRRVGERRPAGGEYRQRKSALRALLGDPERLHAESCGSNVAAVFDRRRAALGPVGQKLATLEARKELSRPRDRLWESIVHLHCNRLLGAGAESEDVVIELLYRTREGLDHAPSSHPPVRATR